MANRIGLNINSSGIPNAETLAFCNGGASAYVIMNDPGMAQRVYDQTGAIVISARRLAGRLAGCSRRP